MKRIKTWMFNALGVALALGLLAGPGVSWGQQKEVTVAYQLIVGPLLVGIADGRFEKATGYKIRWRQFDSGAKVATAMASGDVHLGVIGSSPLAAAVSRGVDLQLFWILDDINEAEALVVRNGSGINGPRDLKGKKIAVPFVSTTHFHTMFALELWGIKPTEVRLLNMQPNQIAAAWERGDIDAAYVWDPALSRIKQNGKVLVTSGELSRKGKATFDGIAANRKWAEVHQDFMVKFTKTLADLYAAYAKDGARWTAESPEVKAMVKLVGGEPKDVAEAVKLYGFPTVEEQASNAWLGGGKDGGAVRALQATAEFLRAQKSIDSMAPDYSEFVTSRYAEAVLGR